MTKNRLSIKRQMSDTRLTSDSNLYHELPYRGKLRRGKVTKFQLSDQYFSPTNYFPRR